MFSLSSGRIWSVLGAVGHRSSGIQSLLDDRWYVHVGRLADALIIYTARTNVEHW